MCGADVVGANRPPGTTKSCVISRIFCRPTIHLFIYYALSNSSSVHKAYIIVCHFVSDLWILLTNSVALEYDNLPYHVHIYARTNVYIAYVDARGETHSNTHTHLHQWSLLCMYQSQQIDRMHLDDAYNLAIAWFDSMHACECLSVYVCLVHLKYTQISETGARTAQQLWDMPLIEL